MAAAAGAAVVVGMEAVAVAGLTVVVAVVALGAVMVAEVGALYSLGVMNLLWVFHISAMMALALVQAFPNEPHSSAVQQCFAPPFAMQRIVAVLGTHQKDNDNQPLPPSSTLLRHMPGTCSLGRLSGSCQPDLHQGTCTRHLMVILQHAGARLAELLDIILSKRTSAWTDASLCRVMSCS